MKRFLLPQEREHLKSRHRLERDKRVCDRIKAVLLFDEGWDCKQIAHVLLISDDAIEQHVREYQERRKLKPENGGSSGRLGEEQSKKLSLHLQEHTYLYTKDIVAYVKNVFGINYTVPGMTAWLHAHNFSYKKPAVVPGRANKQAQEQWMKEYDELKATLPPDEAIPI